MLSTDDPIQQVLGVPECLRLLGTTEVGRIGFTEGALPAVQPVTYRLVDGVLRILAVGGGGSVGALRDGIVVLGVDSFGTDHGDGDHGDRDHGEWAVTVVGPVRSAEDGALVLEPVLVSGWRRAAAGTPR